MSSISSIPPSEPPPSSRLPGRSSGNGPYILGIVAFGAMTVALLLYWKQCMSSGPPPPAPTAAKPVETTQAPVPVFAPPPPPEPEEPDAGPDAAAPVSGGHGTRPASAGACSGCGSKTSVSSSAVESKVAAQASLARGCYNRALRTSAVSGTLMVSVSVGADGRVCGASILNDTVGSPSISNCVLSKFRGNQFPRPKRGCVVINVPIAFKTKK